MSSFIINRNSWHYKWFIYYSMMCREDFSKDTHEFEGNYSWKFPRDFCSYWRQTIVWPALRIGLNTLVNLAILGVILYLGFPGIVGASGLAIIIVGFFAALIGASVFISNSHDKIVDFFKSDSLIAKAYESYEGKFCSTVEYKDVEND